MATANQKTIAELRDQLNDALLQLDVNNQMTAALQQSLEVSTQFNVALLLKLGGQTTLTADDEAAVMGQTLNREDVPEGLKLSVVPLAVGQAAAQAAVSEAKQH